MLSSSVFIIAQLCAVQAATYNATFTWYGTGDERGSSDCSQDRGACDLVISSGFSAAVSQNLYGAATGKASACGKCLKLNAKTNPYNGSELISAGEDVIVMINNLCNSTDTTGRANPLCAQPDLNTTNEFGGQIDVNLCSDSGARNAVLGSSTGLAFGTAEEVDCKDYNVTGTSASASASGSVPSETKKAGAGRAVEAWSGLSLGALVGLLWLGMMGL